MTFKHPFLNSPLELLAEKFNPFDTDSFGERLSQVCGELSKDYELEISGRISKEDSDYSLLKPEIESLLEKRDKDVIEAFMIEAKQGGIYPNTNYASLLDYDLKLLELFYREVYQDDPDFRPELIQHTDKELDEMRGK